MNKVYGFEVGHTCFAHTHTHMTELTADVWSGGQGECKAKHGEFTYKLFSDVFTARESCVQSWPDPNS